MQSLRDKAEKILKIFTSILNFASTKGFTLDRWKTVINVMIYKKPGIYLINCLRVIHLFETDYNLAIGLIFGRRALYSGIANETLHKSQWAQPGRQCADVVVMRELTLAMAMMLKISLGGFENDAAACYDRLLMNMMGTAFKRMGVPEGPLRLQEEVLLLEISTCRYYAIQWQFDNKGQATIMTSAQLNFPEFQLTKGKSGEYVTVPQLDSDDSFRTLGIHKDNFR
jgi:hypothetical protein